MRERRWAAVVVMVSALGFIWWGATTSNIVMIITGALLNFVDVIAFAIRDDYRSRVKSEEENL